MEKFGTDDEFHFYIDFFSSSAKPRVVPTINIFDTDAPDPNVRQGKTKQRKTKNSKTKADW